MALMVVFFSSTWALKALMVCSALWLERLYWSLFRRGLLMNILPAFYAYNTSLDTLIDVSRTSRSNAWVSEEPEGVSM